MNLQAQRRALPGSQRVLYRFAQFTVLAVIFLLVAGAAVTSTDSGLSVPDWPLSFGEVMPPMEGGVFFEHGHRMVATAIGALTVVLAIWLWLKESRAWMRRLGWAALAMVILQGILGGLTVLLKLPVAVSAMHACLAQAFLMTTVFIALALAPGWNRTPRAEAGSYSSLTLWAGIATLTIYIQLVLGAVMRHMNAGLVIPDFPLAYGRLVPPIFTPEIAIHFAHRVWAVVVTAAVIHASIRGIRAASQAPGLLGPAVLQLFLLITQFSLGATVILTQRQPHVTTTHVVVGALLLATSLVLTARSWKFTGSPVVSGASRTKTTPAGPHVGKVTA